MADRETPEGSGRSGRGNRKGGSGKKTTGGQSYTLAFVILAVVFLTIVYMAVTKRSSSVQANNNKEYDAVMELDFSKEYPGSPDKVLEKYNQIDRFLSGNTNDGFTDDDLKALVEKQRMLLHIELLELNPIEDHIEGYKSKGEMLKDENMRLMQSNDETPIFSNDAKTCTIASRQYWTKNMQIDLVYTLKKDESTGSWKILGWYVNSGQGEQEDNEG